MSYRSEVLQLRNGCTDLIDQLGSYYNDRHHSIHWQMCLITHFLRVSVIIASILYNHGRVKPLPLLDYIQQVIEEWCVSDEEAHNVPGENISNDGYVGDFEELGESTRSTVWERAFKRRTDNDLGGDFPFFVKGKASDGSKKMTGKVVNHR